MLPPQCAEICLSEVYTDHKVFVKLSDGLLQPIRTTIGLKQGCCLSSLLFNLFINILHFIFDESCDPVSIESERLQINESKTKVMIFNRLGQTFFDFANHKFYIGTYAIEVVDTYQYLGIKLKPSVAMQQAVGELFDKSKPGLVCNLKCFVLP